MANNLKTMLQIRRILQLLTKGKSIGSISKELGISVNTIKKYQRVFDRSGLSYCELLAAPDQKLELMFCPKKGEPANSTRLQMLIQLIPDYIKRLSTTHITREMLWQQYINQHPNGYAYSQFCEHIGRYMLQIQAVMHLVHKPADVLQIDFAGDKLSYTDPGNGTVIQCPVLVCTLPYSSFCYVEALVNMSQLQLIASLNRCLQYLAGVPAHICSDNLKQVVTKADKYEPVFSQLMSQFALHYNTCLTATRIVKPRDKASVERHVGIAYSRIYSYLEQRQFFSLSELNGALRQLLEQLNDAPMQHKSYSRRQCFVQEEQPLLLPLPLELFEIKYQTAAKVQRDYHVILGQDWHNYSVPYQYIGKKVKIVYDSQNVEIYINLTRIALHARNYTRNGFSTQPEHCPPNHQVTLMIQRYKPEDFVEKARLVGTSTLQLIEKLMATNFFSQQVFKSCLGVLRLGEINGNQRLEKACEIALKGSDFNYRTVKRILDNNQDKAVQLPKESSTDQTHSNIRGGDFFAKMLLN